MQLVVGIIAECILNEVLSLNAQESDECLR